MSVEEAISEIHHLMGAGFGLRHFIALMFITIEKYPGKNIFSDYIPFFKKILDVRDKLIEEIEKQGEKMQTNFFEALHSMPYFTAYFQELSRISVTIPASFAKVKQCFQIGKKTIHKGEIAMACFYASNFDENSFPSPFNFDPERYLTDGTLKHHTFNETSPNRYCLGIDLNYVVLSLLTVELLKVRWRFQNPKVIGITSLLELKNFGSIEIKTFINKADHTIQHSFYNK